MPPQGTIRIDIYHGTSRIDPPPPREVIETVVEYNSRKSVATPDGKIESTIESAILWALDFRDRLVVPTGLIPSITSHLRKGGYKINKKDHREFGKRLKISTAVKSQAMGDEAELFEAVQANPQGVIQVADFKEVIEDMADIIRLYPQARVLIAVGTLGMAHQVRYQLRKAVRQSVALGRHPYPLPDKRIVVTTFGHLHLTYAREWDIVLVPDAVAATQNRGAEMMASFAFPHTRIYAFLRRDAHLTARSARRLEAFAGPTILRRIPDRVGVDMRALSSPHCSKIEYSTPLEFKQKAYWRNDRRNDFVSAVLKALLNANLSKLKKYGIPIVDGVPDIRGGSKPRVAVMVESRQHAAELAKRLPGWEVFAVDDESPKQAHNAPGIVTVSEIAANGVQCDVLVVASGDLASINPVKYQPRQQTVDDQDLLVIDFKDGFDSRASDASKQEMEKASHSGWQVSSLGTD